MFSVITVSKLSMWILNLSAFTDLLIYLSQVVFEKWAELVVQDPCVQYKIQVRCRRLNGSGYWSDWSEPHTSLIYSAKGKPLISITN